MVHQPQKEDNKQTPNISLILSTKQLHHELKQDSLNLEKIKQILNNISSINWQLSPLFQEKHLLYSKAQSRLYQLTSAIKTAQDYLTVIQSQPNQSTNRLKKELIHTIKKCLELSLLHNQRKSSSKLKRILISLAAFAGLTFTQPNIQAGQSIENNIDNITTTADTVKKEDIEKIAELNQLIQIDEQGDLSLTGTTEEGPYCARYVKNAYDKIFGTGSTERDGVTGAAWDMPNNIIKKGGTIIWEGKYPPNDKILKKGDIIGFIYKNSKFKLQAKIFGRGNTHIAIVLGRDINHRIIVAHFFHTTAGEPDRIDHLDELLKSGLFNMINVTRTKNNL